MDYHRLYPFFGLQAHGAFSRWWIHKEYKTYKVVARYYYPYNPRTAEQQAWRDVFGAAVNYWQGFSDSVKGDYNSFSRYKRYSGYNRFLSLYLLANYPPVIPSGGFLLLESGDYFLLETGDKILLD